MKTSIKHTIQLNISKRANCAYQRPYDEDNRHIYDVFIDYFSELFTVPQYAYGKVCTIEGATVGVDQYILKKKFQHLYGVIDVMLLQFVSSISINYSIFFKLLFMVYSLWQYVTLLNYIFITTIRYIIELNVQFY